MAVECALGSHQKSTDFMYTRRCRGVWQSRQRFDCDGVPTAQRTLPPPAVVLLTLPNDRNVPYPEEYGGGNRKGSSSLHQFLQNCRLSPSPPLPPLCRVDVQCCRCFVVVGHPVDVKAEAEGRYGGDTRFTRTLNNGIYSCSMPKRSVVCQCQQVDLVC